MMRNSQMEIERPALRWERSRGSAIEYAIWPERPVTIGREPTNTVAIDSPFVSKAHAIFQYTGGSYVLEDLDSANGTRVNGAAISSAVVQLGDVIEIGDERLLFIDRAVATNPKSQGLGKNAKLALAAGGTLLVLVLLFALILSSAPSSGGGPGAGGATPASSPTAAGGGGAPGTAQGGVPIVVSGDTELTRDAVRRAQATNVNPVDVLVDEAMLHLNSGRLREAAELLTAALLRDQKNEMIRGRLESVKQRLTVVIERRIAEAERAASQLRFEDAAAQWEQVLLLTDSSDPRRSRAEAGIKQARRRR